ncbi:MAG: trypsin-like peptidase domain-containing protein [Phycisphaerae bacterium]|nr:trypsin-like peptidase domain-containing protein [Planctomycetota bacterium]MBL7219776.1 trypsin-like peptidase domain-containing protein [Phycisphaerae bacterium]
MRLGMVGRICVFTATFVALAVGYMSVGGAEADRKAPAPESLYTRLQRASVEILVNGRMTGSGCFVSSDGVVLTACHVVKDKGKHIEIVSPVVGRLTARRIATDRGHDLALLRVVGKNRKYPYLEIAPRLPEPLSEVMLSSSPIWRHGLVLKGSVARARPSYCWQAALGCYIRCIYIDGASPVGSSGGCWTDSRGRVVGVQSGYLNNTDKSPVGIAFAAPADAIAKLLAEGGDRKVATMGAAMEELWTQSQGFIARLPNGTQGIVTPRVNKGGPLDKAGMTHETLIMEIDGKQVIYLDKLLEIVQSRKPGDRVALKVIEPIGKPPREVKIRLAEVK